MLSCLGHWKENYALFICTFLKHRGGGDVHHTCPAGICTVFRGIILISVCWSKVLKEGSFQSQLSKDVKREYFVRAHCYPSMLTFSGVDNRLKGKILETHKNFFVGPTQPWSFENKAQRRTN